MSSVYVRDTLRSWAATSEGLVLPFYDTVNIEQRPDVPQWATLAFIQGSTEVVTYCGAIQERGVVDYVAFGLPGAGDNDLLEAAEHDVAILLSKVDRAGRLTLLRAGPPEDFFQAQGVPWYSVSFSLDYIYAQPAPMLVEPIAKGGTQ